ncbi:usher CupB3 [Dyella flava]|nr:usher CupB3 [Dyella flava]
MQEKVPNPYSWHRALLPGLILSALTAGAHAAAAANPASLGGADPITFDASFFPGGEASAIDLSRFEKSGYVPPGRYHGDVLVNNSWRARGDIVYVNVPGMQSAQPCYDPVMLASYGIDLGKVSADLTHHARKNMPEGTFCGDIGDYISEASASFDPSQQSLSLSVPQLYMMRDARGYVDPSQWDEGINAAVLSYNTNLYRSDMNGRSRNNGYLGLNGSLKLGSWHIYHQGSLNWAGHLGSHYQSAATYLQHDIPAWKAQWVAGDTFTPGDMFDSVRLRGMRMYSDPQMLPQSLRGYAPVIHGLAETNAHVVVRQNGYVIYDTTVAPGPFVIDDLYPTGYGGDLNVEITEADGRIRRFTQPYSAVPQLLRKGQQLWSAAVGRVNQQGMDDLPVIAQLTYQRGLSNLLTGYAGATAGSEYRSMLAGMAFNTRAGALSTDMTYAANRVSEQIKSSGYSLRLGYGRNFSDTGTSVNASAYRYASPGFVGLGDVMELRNAARFGNENYVMRPRNRMDANLSQSLGDDFGQLYFSASWRNYWNNSSRQLDFGAGYSNRWKWMSYSFSVQRTRDTVSSVLQSNELIDRIPGALDGYFASVLQNTIRDTRIFFNITLPLGRSYNVPTLAASVTRSHNSGDNSQVSLNGSLGEARRLTYYASLGHNDGTSASLNGQYNGSSANITGSYSAASSYRQTGAGISGSVVAHSEGVTFSPPAGDTIGLIDARGATGAKVDGSVNSRVDSSGFAIAPYLTPYQLNQVALDPKGTDSNVEMKNTMQQVAPRAGSVVRLRYEVDTSRMLLVDVKQTDGRPVAFGAEVFDDQGRSVGVAGQASRLIVRGAEHAKSLTVRWGDDQDQHCKVDLPTSSADPQDRNETQVVQATCQTTMAATSIPETSSQAKSDDAAGYQ